jgi:hypothetical protein
MRLLMKKVARGERCSLHLYFELHNSLLALYLNSVYSPDSARKTVEMFQKMCL